MDIFKIFASLIVEILLMILCIKEGMRMSKKGFLIGLLLCFFVWAVYSILKGEYQ